MAKTTPPKSARPRGFPWMALALILASGCGERVPQDFLGPDILVRLSVAPRSTQLMLGDSVALSAWGHFRGGDSALVSAIWSAGAGVISEAGSYRAVREGADTVRAAFAADPSLSGTATLEVIHPLDSAIVRLIPEGAALPRGRSIQFEARAMLRDGTEVVPEVAWSSTGGIITPTGLFMANVEPGTYQVMAQIVGRQRSGSTQVEVDRPALESFLLNPSSVTLEQRDTRQFTVAASWSDGSTAGPEVAWSATGGMVSSSGLYTAGDVSGMFEVIARAGDRADTSTVTISLPPPTLTAVILVPEAVSLVPGATEQFTVAGTWSDGSTTAPAVAYAATGGTITAGGLYTAGATPGTFRVVASQQGGTKADTSTVTIPPPAVTLLLLVLSPPSLTLAPGGSQQFTVAGAWSDGSSSTPAVTYSATGGTITTGGLYTAGATPGAYRAIATHQGGTKADTSVVTISVPPPTLAQLVLTPASVTLAPGATQQFTVAGSWSDGSATVPDVTYAATGGTITPGGLYTAGATPGTHRVIATHQGGIKADTSTVSVTTPPGPSPSCLRTVNVSTLSELTSALSQALPGDCILLAAGTYSVTAGTAHTTVALNITRSGIAAAPIIIQGVGSSTIIDLNQRLMYVDASHIQLRSLRVTDFPGVGLWLRGVTGVVIDSVEVDHTLQEAVALHYGSHHNIIKNSLFHDTGLKSPQYGEGIYIGGKMQDGVTLDAGATDNQVLNNHFGPNVRADAVDVKEGADRTILRGNFFDGTGSVYISGATEALVSVVANAVTIDSNFMQIGKIHGVSFIAQGGGRVMSGNLATRNTIDLRDVFQSQRGTAVPYGFQFQGGTTSPMGAVIHCNNVMVTGILSNRPCTP